MRLVRGLVRLVRGLVRELARLVHGLARLVRELVRLVRELARRADSPRRCADSFPPKAQPPAPQRDSEVDILPHAKAWGFSIRLSRCFHAVGGIPRGSWDVRLPCHAWNAQAFQVLYPLSAGVDVPTP